jgi:sec-independent protein translocase protein TatA
VHAVVDAHVDRPDRLLGDGPRRLLPDERQHRAVVVGIAVQVEQGVAAGGGQPLQDGLVAAFADVDDALQHRLSLARSPAAGGNPRRGWYGDDVNLGAPELIIVLIVILVLFGGAKLPKLARSLGQAQNEFKKGLQDGASPDDDPAKDA